MVLKTGLWPMVKRQVLVFTFVFIVASGCATPLWAQDFALGDIGLPDDYYETMWSPKLVLRGLDKANQTMPGYFSWADKDMVTPAKHQGYCGGCWAFAAAGAFESKLLMRGRGLYDLSEQQLISCDMGQNGCAGGSMLALKFWYDKGPMQESCTDFSSYWGDVQDCVGLVQCDTLGYRTKGYYTVFTYSQKEIKTSLYNDGPAYFRYDVYSDFNEYWRDGQGVYVHSSGTFLGGHAVLIIGWDDQRRAWLCKNSWGETDGPRGDGTFWMAYDGHARSLRFGMANVNITPIAPSAPTGLRITPPTMAPPKNLKIIIP